MNLVLPVIPISLDVPTQALQRGWALIAFDRDVDAGSVIVDDCRVEGVRVLPHGRDYLAVTVDWAHCGSSHVSGEQGFFAKFVNYAKTRPTEVCDRFPGVVARSLGLEPFHPFSADVSILLPSGVTRIACRQPLGDF